MARLPQSKDLKEAGKGDRVAGEAVPPWDEGLGAPCPRDTWRPGLASLTARPSQEEATPSMLGHQIGLLMLLWRDKEPVTQSHAHQCVYLLLQLLTQQKGELGAPHLRGAGRLAAPGPLTRCPSPGSTSKFMYLNKTKNFEANARRETEMKFYDLVKVGPEPRAAPGCPGVGASPASTSLPILQPAQGSWGVGQA